MPFSIVQEFKPYSLHKISLHKMKLVPSPLCTLCGDHEETLQEHLLINCAYTKHFWLSVISCLVINTYINMKIDKLDEITILFGISDNNPENYLLNQIIILGKHAIYLCRSKNIKPSLISLLKAKTIETRKLEFLIAIKNNKKRIFSL